MRRKVFCLFLFLLAAVAEASAKFVQEVELKDGTVLMGYVYRQRPDKFIVFHCDHALKDPKAKYGKDNENYTLQWKDVKAVKRSSRSDDPWFNDQLTLNNGTVYVGRIESQQLVDGVVKLRRKDTGKLVSVKLSELKKMEKVRLDEDHDLWFDRQFTNRLRLADKSYVDGLIVTQYYGLKASDCYVELLSPRGAKMRYFLPDIVEYVMRLE